VSAILQTQELTKHYEALVAVNKVTLSVEEGAIHSIIGPNGAGKTTFFNLLCGLTPSTSGRVFFRGQEITRLPLHRVAGVGIGRSFQVTQVFPELPVIENLRLAAQSVRSRRLNPFRLPNGTDRNHSAAFRVLEAVGLTERASDKAAILSHGELRALDIGIALALEPALLLLDEPTSGMSPPEVHSITELITRLRETRGITILLVEHNMNLVMAISDLITVFHRGRVLAEDVPESIRTHEAVRAAYMGSEIGA
jgi:branched-chain amino acid transport system ATP-binding protein